MSFLNMTTNSRGMLVIGLLVAAFVLAGFTALYSTGDEKAMGTGKSIEGQLRDLEKEIALNRSVIGERSRQLEAAERLRATAREADELSAKIQSNRKHINELEARVPLLTKELENETKRFEDDKQAYRKKLISDPSFGTMAELKTLAGKTYREVRMSSIDSTSITFSHQEGSSRVLIKDLPPELRSRIP